MIKKILGVLAICYFLASCKPLNPSIMFKTTKNYEYDVMQADTTLEYIIAPNDVISFRLFTNNGFKLIDVTSENNGQQFQQLAQGLPYTIEYDGMVNLPIINRVNINGMTIREAEYFLEDKYEETFIDPFILLNVINRRVTIFPGDGGSGRVITLENNNIKLLEALALAGGLSDDGRSNRIKLIRGDLSNPQVYKIDLRKIDNISQANIILQANDIIYVEPIGVTINQAIGEVAPLIALITSFLTLYVVLDRL